MYICCNKITNEQKAPAAKESTDKNVAAQSLYDSSDESNVQDQILWEGIQGSRLNEVSGTSADQPVRLRPTVTATGGGCVHRSFVNEINYSVNEFRSIVNDER